MTKQMEMMQGQRKNKTALISRLYFECDLNDVLYGMGNRQDEHEMKL